MDGGNSRIFPKLCFIKGIYNSGYKELDDNIVFTSKEFITKVMKDNIYLYKEIILNEDIEIKDALKKFGLEGISVTPWYRIDQQLYTNLITSEQTLLIVFIVIALLSGFFCFLCSF